MFYQNIDKDLNTNLSKPTRKEGQNYLFRHHETVGTKQSKHDNSRLSLYVFNQYPEENGHWDTVVKLDRINSKNFALSANNNRLQYVSMCVVHANLLISALGIMKFIVCCESVPGFFY